MSAGYRKNWNDGGKTPMIWRGTPSTTSVRPIGSAPPSFRCQYPWEMMAVGALPGRSSSAPNCRPRIGSAPSRDSASCVTSRLCTASGSPEPLTVTGDLSQSQCAMPSNVRL